MHDLCQMTFLLKTLNFTLTKVVGVIANLIEITLSFVTIWLALE